jgi:hypothetical protein
MEVGGQCHAPAALLPGKQTRYPLYSKLGGHQGWSGWEQKISLPLGFDPSIVQHLASRYTDYAILAHHLQGASLCSKRHILHQHVALSSVNGIVQNTNIPLQHQYRVLAMLKLC